MHAHAYLLANAKKMYARADTQIHVACKSIHFTINNVSNIFIEL